MSQYFWVVGTDTDVGKTVVTTYTMRYFQTKGLKVTTYKPVQTGLIVEEGRHYYGDTEFYKTYSEDQLVDEHINSFSFKEAASPHYAAMLEGAEIEEEVILQHIHSLKSKYDYVICEGAGGLYVPLNKDGNDLFIYLIKKSQLPVILVTDTKLGTINRTLLSLEALKTNEIPIIGVVFNGFENSELEKNNIETIQQVTDIPSLVLPRFGDLSELREIAIESIPFFERMLHR